jgi:hypothetical protein
LGVLGLVDGLKRFLWCLLGVYELKNRFSNKKTTPWFFKHYNSGRILGWIATYNTLSTLVGDMLTILFFLKKIKGEQQSLTPLIKDNK